MTRCPFSSFVCSMPAPPYSPLHPQMDSIWGSFQYLCPSETIGPLYMALIPVVCNVILETSLAYTDTPCLPSAPTPVFTAGSCVLVMRQEVIITGDCTLRSPHSGVRRPPRAPLFPMETDLPSAPGPCSPQGKPQQEHPALPALPGALSNFASFITAASITFLCWEPLDFLPPQPVNLLMTVQPSGNDNGPCKSCFYCQFFW